MTRILLLLLAGVGFPNLWAQTTIDSTEKYAYAANAGWISFRHDQPRGGTIGVMVGEAFLAGDAYAANFGWIGFGDGSPSNGIAYENTDAADFGVNHDGAGNLTGLAYGANVGWINFGWADATNSNRPRFDLITGRFVGYAYSANLGWIQLGTTHLTAETIICKDTDGDGLGDAWEYEHFGNLTTANAMTDMDGDGQKDGAEYEAQTDPDNGADYLDFVYHTLSVDATRLEVVFRSSPSRLYLLETSETMQAPWEDAGLGVFLPDPGKETSKMLSFQEDLERKFVRVRPVKPLQP